MAPRIEVKGLFFVYLALSLLFIPIKWVASWLIAAAFHELCHLIALRSFRCDISQISIGLSGAVISSSPVSNAAAFVCEAAGPIGSFLLLSVSKLLPTVAICGFVQGVFNLLPMRPLDGSKILDRFLSLYLSVKEKEAIIKIVSVLVSTVLLIGCFCLYRMSFGPIPLLAVLILIFNSRKNSLQISA